MPTRTDVTIPQEIIDATFDPATYANAVGISDAEHYAATCAEISEWWAENIIPLLWEYSTKEEMLPSPMAPFMYRIEPRRAIRYARGLPSGMPHCADR